MKKLITINNSSMEGASPDQDSKHRGEGADTQNYIEISGLIIQEVEIFLERKYNCFKQQLANESERKYEEEPPFEDDSVINLNLPFFGMQVGPGKIGSYAHSRRKRGYAGESNLYLGIPDREAEDLSKKLERIIKEEKEEYIRTISDNCDITD